MWPITWFHETQAIAEQILTRRKQGHVTFTRWLESSCLVTKSGLHLRLQLLITFSLHECAQIRLLCPDCEEICSSDETMGDPFYEDLAVMLRHRGSIDLIALPPQPCLLQHRLLLSFPLGLYLHPHALSSA